MEFPQIGKDYDVATKSIRCNADKIGARVYIVNGLRILAYSKAEAEQEELCRFVDCGREFITEENNK